MEQPMVSELAFGRRLQACQGTSLGRSLYGTALVELGKMNARIRGIPSRRWAIKQLLHQCGIEVSKYPPHDFDHETRATFGAVKHYTMTSPERVFALCNAVRYVVANGIPGSIVECGVWRGGSAMAAARTLLELGERSRELVLFDTFDGMVAPGQEDLRYDDASARELLTSEDPRRQRSLWAKVSLDEVKRAMSSVGYPEDRVRYVKGPVEESLPHSAPASIAILRLDTDWYESTKHELVHLFPRIVDRGVLIIDDYGAWQGARKAVDEYIAEHSPSMLLNRIDDTGRIGTVMRGRSLK